MHSTQGEREEVRSYLDWQLGKSSRRKLKIQHVEKISADTVMGIHHETWNCITNQGKWWVLTNPMNFYTQKDFKSADVVLTFHVGLSARIASRAAVPVSESAVSMFGEVWRK